MHMSKSLLLAALSFLFAIFFTVEQSAVATAATLAQGDEADDGRIYWSQNQRIIRAKLDGTDEEEVLNGLKLRNPVFNASGEQMYGIGTDDVIRRANVDGSEIAELLAPGGDPSNLRIDTTAGKLYWVDDTSIRRANLDGGQVETLVTGQSNPTALRLDPQIGKMYWIDNVRHIRSANLGGTGVAAIYSADPSDTGVGCLNVDPVDNRVYWLLRQTNFEGPLMRANHDGTGVQTLPLEDVCPTLNADNRKLYWVLRQVGNEIIQRSNLDGSNVEDVVSGVDAANSLSFDQTAGMIYWYEATLTTSKIRRADLGGGPAQDLVNLRTNPFGFGLNLAQQQMIWEVNGTLEQADLAGNNRKAILVGVRFAGPLALDLEDDRIFWSDVDDIRVANLDGTDSSILWTSPSEPGMVFQSSTSLLVVDAEAAKLYWISEVISGVSAAQNSQTVLMRANLDGTAIDEVGILDLGAPYAIDLVNQRVYGYHQLDPKTRELARANFDGSNLELLGVVAPSSASYLKLAVDGAGGKLYWIERILEDGVIRQGNLDASEPSSLITSISPPALLELDLQSGKIYWVSDLSNDEDSIERANLDGSERETLLDQVVYGLAFDAEGLGTPAPEQTEKSIHMPLIATD